MTQAISIIIVFSLTGSFVKGALEILLSDFISRCTFSKPIHGHRHVVISGVSYLNTRASNSHCITATKSDLMIRGETTSLDNVLRPKLLLETDQRYFLCIVKSD